MFMNDLSFAPLKPVLLLVLGLMLAGCRRDPDDATLQEDRPETLLKGQPIAVLSTTNVPGSNNPAPFVPADFSRVDPIEDGVIQLGWDKLSGFKFDVYEVYSETNAGRALIRSDDTIPAPMKAYDGRAVSITGFVLPLRTKKGLVTEFLLLRDQGACCFGARAQINHFIRVKYGAGFEHTIATPLKVSGNLQVGEVFIQGYLTGIYGLDARKVDALRD